MRRKAQSSMLWGEALPSEIQVVTIKTRNVAIELLARGRIIHLLEYLIINQLAPKVPRWISQVVSAIFCPRPMC